MKTWKLKTGGMQRESFISTYASAGIGCVWDMEGGGESLKGQFTQKLDTYSRSRFQRFGHKMQIICMIT